MIAQSTLDFLKELEQNNNKDWFDAHRKAYEAARKDLLKQVAEIIEITARWDERMKTLDPKKCVFRINRDIRFSKDKSPYKNNMGAIFAPGGKHHSGAGFYLHIQPGECFMGGGVYAPDAKKLAAIRQEIDYNLKEFGALLNEVAFVKHYKELQGSKLKTAPKGYSADHEGIEWLKHKDFIAMTPVSDKDLTSPGFNKQCEEAFRALAPLNAFLDRAALPAGQ